MHARRQPPQAPTDRVAALLHDAHRLHVAALEPARWPEVLGAVHERYASREGGDRLSSDEAVWIAEIVDNAAAVCAARAELVLRSALATSALDVLPFGVAILDPAGLVERANYIARDLLASSAPLRAALPNLDVAGSTAFRIEASAGAEALEVVCLETSPPQTSPPAAGRLVLFVAVAPGVWSAGYSIPDTIGEAATLASAFDLTAAETRVAFRLIAGDSVVEAARACDIKVTTVRTHLGRLFEKTHTTRQATLVRVLTHALDLPPRV